MCDLLPSARHQAPHMMGLNASHNGWVTESAVKEEGMKDSAKGGCAEPVTVLGPACLHTILSGFLFCSGTGGS